MYAVTYMTYNEAKICDVPLDVRSKQAFKSKWRIIFLAKFQMFKVITDFTNFKMMAQTYDTDSKLEPQKLSSRNNMIQRQLPGESTREASPGHPCAPGGNTQPNGNSRATHHLIYGFKNMATSTVLFALEFYQDKRKWIFFMSRL